MQFSITLLALFASAAIAAPIEFAHEAADGSVVDSQPAAAAPAAAAPAAADPAAAAAPAVQNKAADTGADASAASSDASSGSSANGAVTDDLVPQFNIQQGVGDDGTGTCQGLDGKGIPCTCPPDRDEFISKVQENVNAGDIFGAPVSFPTDDSTDSQLARLNTAILTLQNFSGQKGVGCPVVSTDFLKQQAALSGQ